MESLPAVQAAAGHSAEASPQWPAAPNPLEAAWPAHPLTSPPPLSLSPHARGPPIGGTNPSRDARLPDAPAWSFERRPARAAAQPAAQSPPAAGSLGGEAVPGEGALVGAVRDHLLQHGGVSSSRDVGRNLAAVGLLSVLKERHAGLYHFLQAHSADFRVEMRSDRSSGALEYKARGRWRTGGGGWGVR